MIKRTYEDPSTDEFREVSAAWANDYDRDLINGHGYKAIEDAVDGFVKRGLARDAHILDAGRGTGMVGLRLREAPSSPTLTAAFSAPRCAGNVSITGCSS